MHSALRLGFGLKSVPVVAAQVLPNCASVSHSRLSLALDSRRILLQSRMTKLRRVCRWWDACKPPSLRGQETHIGWRTWVSRLPSLAGIYVKPTADAAGIAHLPVPAPLSSLPKICSNFCHISCFLSGSTNSKSFQPRSFRLQARPTNPKQWPKAKAHNPPNPAS